MSKGNGIYVATESFSAVIEGEPYVVHKGKTRVREGHPLLDGNAEYFKPVEDDLTYELEDAAKAESKPAAHESIEPDEGEDAESGVDEDGDPDSESDEPVSLADKTRSELDELAATLNIENPDKLPNKQAVVEAIEAAQKSE